MSLVWRITLLGTILLAGCATVPGGKVTAQVGHEVPAGVEVVRLTVYPKMWAGAKATWVDVVLRNLAAEPRKYRAIVTVDDEPSFATSSAKPVAPKMEETLTVSTSARRLPIRILIQVQVVD